MNKDDVPAYARRPTATSQEVQDLMERLKKPLDPRISPPVRTIRTPSTQALRFAPNGVPQLLKERGTHPVSAAQTTQATPLVSQTSTSTDSGESRFKKFSRENKLFVLLASLLLLMLLTLFVNKITLQWSIDAYERVVQLDALAKKASAVPADEKRSVPPLVVHDGDQFGIPENAKVAIAAPATVVIVNTAWRIKSFTGDFTVERLGTGESASVPDEGYFARVPKGPTKVRIVVKSGTVELGT